MGQYINYKESYNSKIIMREKEQWILGDELKIDPNKIDAVETKLN